MNTHIEGKLYNVTIEASFVKATTNIKFPSLFFITWKTNDHKHTAQTARYSAQKNIVTFDQTTTLTIPVIYEQKQKTFIKKDTQIQLNLVSKNRPDQPKLVGRITINAASLINNNPYLEPTEFPLQFCSVNATLTASFKVIEQVQTDVEVHELQKSIGDGISFHSTLRVNTQPNSALDRSKDSVSVGKQIAGSRILQKHVIKKEPESNRSTPNKRIYTEQSEEKKIEFKKQKEVDRKSQETNSARGAKITEVLQSSSYKKIGSVLSEQSKNGQQNTRLKVEIQTLKLQINRLHQQGDRNRAQYSKKVKECEFSQLELKQKQSTIQQSANEIHILKAEGNRLRQEVGTLRDEAVQTTIKIAELKDSLNRVTTQLSTSENHLKRLEGANQQSSSANKQFKTQIIDLQKQVTKYEHKCMSLEQSKTQLEAKIQAEIAKSSQSAEKHQKQIQNLTIELETIKNEMKASQQISNVYQSRVQILEEEVKRLTLVEEQFLEARNSWSISEEQLKQERDRKSQRTEELEDTLISLNDRIRYLEGQNELLTQNCKRSHQQYQKLQEQKKQLLTEAEQKYLRCFNSLQQEKSHSQGLDNEKNTLEQNIDALITKYEDLQNNYQNLNNQHNILRGQFDVLAEKLSQKQNKCQELEELIIAANQQRQRELTEAGDREKNLQLKVKQLQSQLQYATEQISMFEEKISISEQELKGREELIQKLQQGLNTQIERTEALNVKIIASFQKEERMKDIMAAMEKEHQRLCALIEQQEKLDLANQSKLISKQSYINDLVQKLQESQNYAHRLSSLLEEKNIEHEMMTIKLENSHKNIKQLEANIEQNTAAIGQLERKVLDLEDKLRNTNRQVHEKQESNKHMVGEFEKNISQLNETITQLESRIADFETLLIEKEGLLIDQNQKLASKEEQANLLSDHIEELKNRIQELQAAKSQIENQLLIKQQILIEQNNKYSELQNMYETLVNDQATFDMNRHREDMREKQIRINQLQNQQRILGIQVSKIPTLERAVKIKTIQLNSFKFKDKSGDFQSQLLKLKDQEISSLLSQKQHLLNIEREFLNIQHELASLRNELELIEQEKFDVESLANERALALDQAKEQNKKLVEEITIIGQKHGELEKMLHELTSNQGSDPRKEAASLKSQNIILKKKLTDYEKAKEKLSQLQKKNMQIASQNHSLKLEVNDLKSKCNLQETYQSLRKLIEERTKGKQQEKMVQAIEKIVGKQGANKKAFEQKIKNLTRDFGRMKVQLLKIAESKSQQEKAKFIGQLQSCENSIGAIVLLFE